MRGWDERGGRGKIRTLDHPVNNPPEPTNPAATSRFFSTLPELHSCRVGTEAVQ